MFNTAHKAKIKGEEIRQPPSPKLHVYSIGVWKTVKLGRGRKKKKGILHT